MNRVRVDRLLTLYCFFPILRRVGARRPFRIPILMYHSVSHQSSGDSHPYFELNTEPGIFDLQMTYLKNHAYRVIGLDEVVERVCVSGNEGQIGKEKYAVLTFDDGFRNFHDVAYPILKKHGFSATVFLSTKYMKADRWTFQGRQCLTWDQVRFLSSVGIAFGSHTVTHNHLVEMDSESIEKELNQSKDEIEQETGKTVRYFSFPYRYPEQDREFVKQISKLLAQAGYRAAVSTRIGTVRRGDNIYALKRLPINSNDDPSLFRAKLEGGYDWLYRLQCIKKFMHTSI